MPAEDNVRCHCNRCGGITKHTLRQKRVVEVDPGEDVPFVWKDTYEVLECMGCETICLRLTEEDPAGKKTVTYYPPRISRRHPRWSWELPNGMRELLDEIYAALHNGSRRLALMGTRTLIDMFVLKEVGDTGTFDAKLKALRDKGVLSEKNREMLSAALDAGSAAAHRGYNPSREELEAALDIVENVLQARHQLSRLAEQLRKKIPSRPSNRQIH